MPMPTPTPTLVHNRHEDFLPYVLNRVTALMNAEFSTALRAEGLTITQWRVLAFLEQGNGFGVSALSSLTATDQATLSRALVRMLERGLIDQAGSDHDSRMVITCITRQGRSTFKRVLPVAIRLSSRALAGIEQADVEHMIRTLQQLQRNLMRALDK